MPLTDVRNKVAVITGGASGIGLAMARRFKREGMRLVLADAETEPLQQAAAELDAPDLGVLAVLTDVRDPASLDALARATLDRFGAAHLLCNNAGVSRMAGHDRLTDQDWRWLFDVNLFGVVNGVRSFLPLLKANPEGGHIVNTASLSGLMATRSQAAYAASKYAVVGFSEVLALELAAEGARVGVTAVCPGPVRTNISSSARNRAPEYGQADTSNPAPDIHERAFRAELTDDQWATADQIADQAFDAVLTGQFWVITHPGMMGPVDARHSAIMAAASPPTPASRVLPPEGEDPELAPAQDPPLLGEGDHA